MNFIWTFLFLTCLHVKLAVHLEYFVALFVKLVLEVFTYYKFSEKTLYYFPPVFIVCRENHPLKTLKSNVFLTLCQLIMSDVTESVRCPDHENLLSLSYSKLALEYD